VTDELQRRKRVDDKREGDRMGDSGSMVSIQLLADVLQPLGEQDPGLFMGILGGIDDMVVKRVVLNILTGFLIIAIPFTWIYLLVMYLPFNTTVTLIIVLFPFVVPGTYILGTMIRELGW
jgi:hypothetical protein